MKLLYFIFIFYSVFWLQFFEEIRNRTKVFTLIVKCLHLSQTIFHLDLLSQLNSVHYLGSHIKFLEKFLDNFILNHPIGPSKTPLLSFPGSEGQHMIILIRIRFPKLPKKRKLEFLPPILPIIVDNLRKMLNLLILQQIFILPLNKRHHPPLTPRQIHILTSF